MWNENYSTMEESNGRNGRMMLRDELKIIATLERPMLKFYFSRLHLVPSSIHTLSLLSFLSLLSIFLEPLSGRIIQHNVNKTIYWMNNKGNRAQAWKRRRPGFKTRWYSCKHRSCHCKSRGPDNNVNCASRNQNTSEGCKTSNISKKYSRFQNKWFELSFLMSQKFISSNLLCHSNVSSAANVALLCCEISASVAGGFAVASTFHCLYPALNESAAQYPNART